MYKDIDYSNKLMHFKALTETNDDEVALNYLENFDWDEEIAAQRFFEDNSGKQTRNVEENRSNLRGSDERHREEGGHSHSGGMIGNMMNRMSEMMNFDKMFTPTRIMNEFFQSGPIMNSSSSNRQAHEKNEILSSLPFRAQNLEDFYKTIKNKIGILIVYNQKETEFIEHSLEKILFDTEIMSILEHQFVTFALMDTTKEAKTIIEKRRIKTPTCLFMYNPLGLDKNESNVVIDKLEGQSKIEKLSETILVSLHTKEKVDENNRLNKSNQTKNYYQAQDYGFDYEEDDDSHAAIIRQQEEEMRQLEKLEEDKRRKAKHDEDLRKKKEKEEREKLEKQKEEEDRRAQMALIKRKQLTEEPKADDPNSTHILFRHPDGVTRSERRFSKQNTVKDMYDYVESLEGVAFNNHEGKFELIQAFPFVNFSDKTKTFQEEKLFPNAVIQIREKEV